MFEPPPTADNVEFAVAIDIGFSESFMFDAALPTVNFGGRPGLGLPRISGDFRKKEATGALVPVNKLSAPVAIKIAEHYIMMFGRAAVLDQTACPTLIGAEIRVRIFPPPDLVTLGVAPHRNIKIAIAINVVKSATGFNVKHGVINQ